MSRDKCQPWPLVCALTHSRFGTIFYQEWLPRGEQRERRITNYVSDTETCIYSQRNKCYNLPGRHSVQWQGVLLPGEWVVQSDKTFWSWRFVELLFVICIEWSVAATQKLHCYTFFFLAALSQYRLLQRLASVFRTKFGWVYTRKRNNIRSYRCVTCNVRTSLQCAPNVTVFGIFSVWRPESPLRALYKKSHCTSKFVKFPSAV